MPLGHRGFRTWSSAAAALCTGGNFTVGCGFIWNRSTLSSTGPVKGQFTTEVTCHTYREQLVWRFTVAHVLLTAACALVWHMKTYELKLLYECVRSTRGSPTLAWYNNLNLFFASQHIQCICLSWILSGTFTVSDIQLSFLMSSLEHFAVFEHLESSK